MVSDAQKLFGEGRYDEAALVATAVLENDPDNVDALALRGDCHERLGEYNLALDCYKQILVIQPESQLDRIRVARLEKMIDSDIVEVGQPTTRRRTALGAAVAAAILLVSTGSALIIATQQTDGEIGSTVEDSSVSQAPFYAVAPVPGGPNFSPTYQPGPADSDLDGLENVENSDGSIPPILTRGVPNDFQRNRLPGINDAVINPNGTTRFDRGELIDPTSPREGNTTVATNGNRIQDPDPPVVAEEDNGNSNMIAEVKVREFASKPTSGSEVVGDANEVTTLIRVAREHYILGNYDKAAAAFKQAIKLGASPASTNQRLAQCYEKLGEKALAIQAYEKAIEAFEKLDQDDTLVKASLDACRQALKLLRSN